MTSGALPLTSELARSWVAAAVPWWVPRVLALLWVVPLVTAIIADDRPCTAVDPSVCGPDLAFAWWFVVCLATPVLLLWLPSAGCLAGVMFAVADVLKDPTTAGRVAFGAHGVA